MGYEVVVANRVCRCDTAAEAIELVRAFTEPTVSFKEALEIRDRAQAGNMLSSTTAERLCETVFRLSNLGDTLNAIHEGVDCLVKEAMIQATSRFRGELPAPPARPTNEEPAS